MGMAELRNRQNRNMALAWLPGPGSDFRIYVSEEDLKNVNNVKDAVMPPDCRQTPAGGGTTSIRARQKTVKLHMYY